jgi:hypothetical protein
VRGLEDFFAFPGLRLMRLAGASPATTRSGPGGGTAPDGALLSGQLSQ